MSRSTDSHSAATLDALARELAGGRISRRQAVGGLVSAVAGAWILKPAQAFGLVIAKCAPSHRCGKDCCGRGERCRTHNGHHKCVCKAGLKRCSGKCVDTSTNVNNCGACGVVCASGQVCSQGTCTTQCAAGQTNCSGSCVDVQTDADNCGACGNVCAGNATGVSCAGGTCSYTCTSGYGDCDQTPPNLNGCETQLNTTANCGACGAACDTLHSNGATCNGTTCLYTSCQPGFADCNSAAPNLSGCETSITTTQNCGGCGNVCSGLHVQSASCVGGLACSYTCQAGYVDCNQTGANTNGCECEGNGCCSGACQTKHSDGLGESFFDCTALNTYNVTQALKACAAHNGGSSDPCSESLCGDNGHVVCDSGHCWKYDGTTAIGHVSSSSDLCPSASDPVWN